MELAPRIAQNAEELVRRFQRGDERAFDQLIELSAPRLLPFIIRKVGNAEDAQDVLQEVCIALHSALPRFKWESAFSTFLYRIALNICTNELRRRRNRPLLFDDFCEDEESSSPFELLAARENVEEMALQREQQQCIEQAIWQIPEPYHTVFVLYEAQGLSYQEIATVLKINVGTVRSRLNRAREHFKRQILEERELFPVGQRLSSK